jgi:hypothetical protein
MLGLWSFHSAAAPGWCSGFPQGHADTIGILVTDIVVREIKGVLALLPPDEDRFAYERPARGLLPNFTDFVDSRRDAS